jgi:uncharacterized protein YvpB
MKKILLLLMVSFLIGMGYAAFEESKMKKSWEDYETHAEDSLVFEETSLKKTVSPIEVPLISQLPELVRGCEVTSLAMLLQHAGVDVGKMELAKNVKKDPTPYQLTKGAVSFGNPNDGFVGDMYSFNNMGYGVYHGPIAELAEKYLPGQILDLSGEPFEDAVLAPLSNERPVWVIINTKYQKLADSEFRTWNTPTGKVKITWNEHAVVVTGFDEHFVYFNDPLSKATKADRASFEAAWLQMGSQAITYQ